MNKIILPKTKAYNDLVSTLVNDGYFSKEDAEALLKVHYKKMLKRATLEVLNTVVTAIENDDVETLKKSIKTTVCECGSNVFTIDFYKTGINDIDGIIYYLYET